MKAHPAKGAAIMEAIPQLADIIPGMKYHHEKWEGGGYPDGLKGEEIPLQARIVAVADAFDAMTTTRPYQKAMEVTYVLERLRELAHKRFDVDVVEALVRSHAKGELIPTDGSAAVARGRIGGAMKAPRLAAGVLALAALAAGLRAGEEGQDPGRDPPDAADGPGPPARRASRGRREGLSRGPQGRSEEPGSARRPGRLARHAGPLSGCAAVPPEGRAAGARRTGRTATTWASPRWSSGQYKEAALAFAAAEASPNSDDRISAAINRGRLAQRQGDLAGAEQEFTLAMEQYVWSGAAAQCIARRSSRRGFPRRSS